MTKIAFISGATSGIGLATVKQLVDLGWHIYAGGLPQDDFSVLPNGIIRVPIDITDASAVNTIAEKIRTEHGYLNGLVNSAGIHIPGALETLPIDKVRQQFEVNVFGHLQVIQAMLPLLRKTDTPRIVNVSSLMGKVAMPILGAYSMSKHALEAMTDVLRLELAQWNIHISAVEPGAVNTPMTDSMENLLKSNRESLSEELLSHYGNMIENMMKALETQSSQAVSPERVASAIIHALTSKKPKTRYPIGISTTGLLTMRNFVPDIVGDAILRRALRLDNEK